MLEDSINFNPDQVKVPRFKSAKIIRSFQSNQKINKISYKKSLSYDNINKKIESKLSISKFFPISESYSLLSNSHEDHFIFKAQSNKYKNFKKYKTFEQREPEPEIKKNCSSNLVNSTNKLLKEFGVENKQESENSNIKIKIKRPNFLIKSCFYKKNSDIYLSKIGRTMSKKETSPMFNFFREIDVEPEMDLLKKNYNYKLSTFRKPKKKNNKNVDEKNIDNNIFNEDFIKIIKADSSDDEKEVKSFHGDNYDFANEIEKINKMKDKEDVLNDSINNIKNNNSINISEGLNNSNYFNRSLNEDFVFKNNSKIFKSNNNNLSISFNNSMVKAQEDKINNNENNIIIQEQNEDNFEFQDNYNNDNYTNFINNSNNINNTNNSGNYQSFEGSTQNSNILYQNINNNFINNNNNDNLINNNKYKFQNNFKQNEQKYNNYPNQSNNFVNQNNFQYPYINNTINYIFQNNTNLFYNNPFYLKKNLNPNFPYNYIQYPFNNTNNQNFQNQFNPIINANILNNYNNYFNQNNNIINNNSLFNNYNNKNKQNIPYNKIEKNYTLDNFKDLSKIPNTELAKNSYILAKRKDGSKYLENIIESNPSLASKLFLPYALPYFEEISNNKYGNFYIKKIIKYLNKELLSFLIEFINPLIIRLGTNQYGSKILEQLIKCIKEDENLVSSFIQKILPNLIFLINDLNGTHIIYKLILIKSKSKSILEEQIMQNIKSIYISREGSNLLKKFFDIINKECNNNKDFNKMILFINIISNNLPLIIMDQYGNYLIRHIIHNLNNFVNEILYKNIINNVVYYSNQKYSSNVVENCLDNIKFRQLIIEEFSNQQIFNRVFLNEYGNYVIQKVLSLAKEDKKFIFFNYIIQVSKKLHTLPFGQKIISKLLINYPKLSMYLNEKNK